MDSIKIALPLLKKSEGLRLKAYPDPATKGKPYTIGYGATYYENGQEIQPADKISKERAEELLIFHATQARDAARKYLKKKLTPNQEAAVISLVFNIGAGNFAKSTLLRKLNANPSDPTIEAEFKKFIYANKKIFPGLVSRRAEEAKLFFTPLTVLPLFLLVGLAFYFFRG